MYIKFEPTCMYYIVHLFSLLTCVHVHICSASPKSNLVAIMLVFLQRFDICSVAP